MLEVFSWQNAMQHWKGIVKESGSIHICFPIWPIIHRPRCPCDKIWGPDLHEPFINGLLAPSYVPHLHFVLAV